MQQLQKKKWITVTVTSENVQEMLIADMTAKYIYKQNQLKIVKDCNGIIVYYNAKIRGVYNDSGVVL
jgi:hypothetical protein